MTVMDFFRRRVSVDVPVFVDLTSDYGFKAIFGNELNKDVLLALLRQLVTDEKIAEIEYIDKERRMLRRDAKSCAFDVYCKTGDGRRIIIEMQHNSQKFFLSRSIFYSTFAVQDQLKRGVRDYDFAPVYMISFVCEDISDFKGSDDFITRVNLYAGDGRRLVARNLNYIYIELDKFRKTEEELSEDDDLEGMIYSIKHMSRLTEIPQKLRKPMFQRLYEASRFAAMGAVEQYKYIRTMTTKADIKAQMDYKYEQGMEKGMEKGKMDEKIGIAKNLISLGIADEVIAKSTGLTVEQIEEMK